MLAVQNITKIYNAGQPTQACLFHRFSLSVAPGEFVSIVGSNGSGKTSLLNILCGSIPVESGEILLDGKEITHLSESRRARWLGRVFQNPSMGSCPDLTILENLSLAENKNKRFGLAPAVNRRKTEQHRAMLAPLGLGLENLLNSRVGSLSGGQRQALSLLLATMTPIRFLILDEHTAALDPKTAEVIMQLTADIVAKKNLTAIMVTHNLRHAAEYGNRLLMMHRGEVVLDKSGKEKRDISVPSLLSLFNDMRFACES